MAKTAVPLAAAVGLAEILYRMDSGPQNTIIIYTLAIFVVTAITDGYVYGIATAIAGAVAYDFQVTEPRLNFSFTIGFPVTFLIMLLVTLVTSAVTAQFKARAKIEDEKKRVAEFAYKVSRSLLSSRDVAAIAGSAVEYLGGSLSRSVAFFEKPAPEKPARGWFWEQEGDLAAGSFAPPESWGLAEGAAQEAAPEITGKGTGAGGGKTSCHPVISNQAVLGAFCVSNQKGEMTGDEESYLAIISSQTALALQVQLLAAKQQETQVMAEAEKTRSNFLRAISHDIRTPLTSILGASTVLLDNSAELDAETKTALVTDIKVDSEWLLGMVTNILSMTRLRGEGMKVTTNLEAAEEVVAQAVAFARKRFPGADIEVEVPYEPLFVRMDGILISQVLTNLMENSLRHGGATPPKVQVKVEKTAAAARFTVLDNGTGIAPDMAPQLFKMRGEKGTRPADAARGMGLGLSICKTIVEAHGGSICGENRPGGGAAFWFDLPLGAAAP